MKFLQSRAARIFGIFVMALSAIAILILLSEGYVKQNVPVSLNDFQVGVNTWDKGIVGLKGTWVAEESNLAIPYQSSNIICNANEKKCVESRALISDAHELSVEQHSYEITHWDEHFLTYSSATQCVESIYTVNRDSQQVSGIIKPANEPLTQCAGSKQEMKLKLASGAEAYRQAQKKFRPVAFNVAGLIAILLWVGFRIQNIKKASRRSEAGPGSQGG
jgi:hypothetical protein